ncbi:MAG TPA: DUF4349 domain-containing protein [Flavobacteriales bacterium]|nr:DUF4349 domain-containing protein [Flavobacteriales bacterium]
MRTTYSIGVAIVLITLSHGCGQAERVEAFKSEGSPIIADLALEKSDVSQPAAPPEPKQALSSNLATFTDSSRRFILAGDLRFRTDDVVKTTFAIEALIARHGGFIANTHLSTDINSRYTTPISKDSLLETTRYTVINRLTIRVPSSELDTTLKALITYVDFLDHRTLSATDVRLALLRDKLNKRRLMQHTDRLNDAIDEQGRKLKETITAEDKLIERQRQADEATLNTMELEDRINYSTLTLDIYQREVIRRDLLPNELNLEAYEPGFFSKATDALKDGWTLLLQFVLTLVRGWSVILLGITAFLLYRRIRRAG